MNFGRAILDDNYFNTEVYWNNIKKVSINSGSEYALGVAIVDSSGNLILPGGVFSTTATLSSVAGNAASVTLLASNTSRLGATIHNDSSAILYVAFAATATTSAFTYKLNPSDTLELKGTVYTGVISGIWASATGNARITELT